jgi:transcriptional regulator with XRE-family HTH domain
MGRNLNEVLASLPAERRRKVDALARTKVEDMLASARTLADIRKAVGKTQVEVALALGVKQNAISQLEQRSDTYLSTFKRFLVGMGMRLELSVVTADGTRVDLSEFRSAGSVLQDGMGAAVAALAGAPVRSSRRAAAACKTQRTPSSVKKPRSSAAKRSVKHATPTGRG